MNEFEKLLSQIKCEMAESTFFTQEDINAIDLCEILENPQDLEAEISEEDSKEDFSSTLSCINEVEIITNNIKADMKISLKYKTIISKLEEFYDNLIIIHEYHKTKYNTLLDFIKTPGKTKPIVIKAEVLPKAIERYCVNPLNKNFSPINVKMNGSTPEFTINIPSLKKIKYKDYENKLITLNLEAELSDKKIVSNLKTIKVFAYEDRTIPIPFNIATLTKNITGALYRGVPGYSGYYFKLEDPMNRLFTLDERGLTANSALLDSRLKASGGTIQDDNNTYYIANLDKHEKFYETFEQELPKKISLERNEILVSVVAPMYTAIRSYAIYEAYLASKSKTIQSTIKAIKDSFDDIDTRINKIRDEITRFKRLLPENKVEESLSKIKCFVNPDNNSNNNPCSSVKKTLGSDPIGFNSFTKGATTGDPDFTSMCYWKEFAKCANKVNLLPLPGDKLKNIRKLRYWPVGLIIPTPAKLIKIPFPQIWKPLVVIPSPLGTIVVFLAQCGIIPSPFVFIVSSTGSKNFLISLKGPQKNMGYDIDDKTNSNGFAGPLFKANVSLPPLDLLKGINLNLGDFSKKLNSSDTPEALLDEFVSKAIKSIDSIGDIRLDALTKPLSDVNETIAAIKADAIKAVSKLNLGTIKFPKDSSKLRKRKTGIQEVIDEFNELSQRGEKFKDKNHFKVKLHINKFISNISSIDLPNLSMSNLTIKDVTERKKKILSDFNREIFKLAKGVSDLKIDTSKLNTGEKIEDIKESYNNATSAYKSFMSNNVEKMLAGASIKLFSPFKKCCTDAGFSKSVNIDPSVLLVFSAIENKISNIINNLSDVDLKNLKINNLPDIKGFFLKRIMKKLPDQSLPKIIDIFNVESILKLIKPVLGVISIPQIPFVSVPGLPSQININVSTLLKPLMIKAIKDLDVVTKTLNNSILSRPAQISSQDLKACLKNSVLSIKDQIDKKIRVFTKISDIYKSINGASKTIIDESFPILKIKAEAKALLKSKKNKINMLNLVDPSVIKVLLSTSLPIFNKLMKLPGSHIPIIILCALEQARKARLLHPVLNQDDIPSWDRLTVKNPLFVIFLDKFCSTAADCTGIVLGRSWG